MIFQTSDQLYSYIYALACEGKFEELKELNQQGYSLSFVYKRSTLGIRLAREKKLETCETLLKLNLIKIHEIILGLVSSNDLELMKIKVSYFLQTYATNPLIRQELLDTAAHFAAEENYLEVANWFLAQGANLKSMLRGAAYRGDETIVRKMLEDASFLKYAIEGAAAGGQKALLFELLNRAPEYLPDAISYAACGERLEIVQSLLRLKPDIELYKKAADGFVTGGHDTTLISFLESLEASNNNNFTYDYNSKKAIFEVALGTAAEKGQFVLLLRLMKKGCFTRIAIYSALETGNIPLLKQIIDLTPESAATKGEFSKEQTLIYAARCMIKSKKKIKELHQLGLTNQILITTAVLERDIDLIKHILENGFNGEPANEKDLIEALQAAIYSDNQELVEFISKYGRENYATNITTIIKNAIEYSIYLGKANFIPILFRCLPKGNINNAWALYTPFYQLKNNESLALDYLDGLVDFINERFSKEDITNVDVLTPCIDHLLNNKTIAFEKKLEILGVILPKVDDNTTSNLVVLFEQFNFPCEDIIAISRQNKYLIFAYCIYATEKQNMNLLNQLIKTNVDYKLIIRSLIEFADISFINAFHLTHPFSEEDRESIYYFLVLYEKINLLPSFVKETWFNLEQVIELALYMQKNSFLIALINNGYIEKDFVMYTAICKNITSLIDELIPLNVDLDRAIKAAETYNKDLLPKLKQLKADSDAKKEMQQKENAIFVQKMQQMQISSKILPKQNEKSVEINNIFNRCFNPSITYIFLPADGDFTEVSFSAHESKITSLYQLFNKFCKGKNNFNIEKKNSTLRVKWKTIQMMDLLKGKQTSFRSITDTSDPVVRKKPQATVPEKTAVAKAPNLENTDEWRKLVKTLTQAEIENWIHQLRYACGNIDGLKIKQDESDNCIVVRFPYADKLAIKEPKSNEAILVSFNEALDNIYSRIKKHLISDKKILAHLEKGTVSLRFYPRDSVIGLGYLQDKLYRHFVKKHAKVKQTTIPTKTTTPATKVKTPTTAEKTTISVSDIKKLFNNVCRQYINEDDNFSFLSLAESKESQTNKFKFSFKQIDEMVVHGKKGAIDPFEFFQAIAAVLPEVKVYDNREKSGEVCVIVDLRHTSIGELNKKMAALQQAFVMPEPRKGKTPLDFTTTTEPEYIIQGQTSKVKDEKIDGEKIKCIHTTIKNLLDKESDATCRNVLYYHLQQLADISAPGEKVKPSDQIDHLVYLLHATRIFERLSLLLGHKDNIFTQWRNVMRHAYAELDWQTFYQTFNPFFKYLGRLITNGTFNHYTFASEDYNDINRLHKAIRLFDCAIKFRTLGTGNKSVERLQRKIYKFFGNDEETQIVAGSKRKSNAALYQLLMDIYQRDDRDIEYSGYANKKKDALIMLFSLIGENNPTAHPIIKNISGILGHDPDQYEQLREHLSYLSKEYFRSLNNNNNNHNYTMNHS